MRKLLSTLFVIAPLLSIASFAAPEVVIIGEDDAYSALETQESELYVTVDASRLASYIPDIYDEGYLCDDDDDDDDDDDSIYEHLAEELLQSKQEIDIKEFGFTKGDDGALSQVFSNTLVMYPELYNVSFEIKYAYDKRSEIITSIFPGYLVADKKELEKTRREIRDEIDKIVSLTNESMSDVEKLLTVYDKIIMNSSYDYTYQKYTAKDLLLDGEAVCQGYASVFYAVAKKLDIPCGFVSSKEMVPSHIWNVVYIDGAWYHIDVTWDDPFAKDSTRVTHSFFLKSNAWMMSQDGGHYGFEFVDSDSEKYDEYFWNEAVSQIIVVENDMFYISDSGEYGSVCRFDPDTETISEVYSYDTPWPAYEGNYWLGAFSGIALNEKRIYFNTWYQVLSCDFDGTKIDTVFTLPNYNAPENTESIYGCRVEGNDICVILGERLNPNSVTGKRVVPLPEIKEVVSGDVTGDGKVTRSDLLRLAKHFSGFEVEMDEAAADVTGDGKVTRSDLLRLAKYFSGFDVELGE